MVAYIHDVRREEQCGGGHGRLVSIIKVTVNTDLLIIHNCIVPNVQFQILSQKNQNSNLFPEQLRLQMKQKKGRM